MSLAPLQLQPLDLDHVKQFYARAKNHEEVFRNILLQLSDDSIEADYFKKSSIEDIFLKYVRVTGFETRVSDFRVGPFSLRNNLIYVLDFPDFDPAQLNKDNAIILIEKSNDSWLYKYTILDNSEVKHESMQHRRRF